LTTSSNAVKLPSNGDGLTAAALDELAQRLAPVVAQHLVNCIDVGNAPLQKGSDPTMKINRVVTINGEKRWIHANRAGIRRETYAAVRWYAASPGAAAQLCGLC